MKRIFVNIELTFRLPCGFPTCEEQLGCLWQFAKTLQRFGMPIENWHPPAATPKEALAHIAFDQNGPTTSLAYQLQNARKQNPQCPSFGVWNGADDQRSAVFTPKYDATALFMMTCRSKGFEELPGYDTVADLVEGALAIWPGTGVEAGPSRYFSQKKVFPDRPGVGWMLYLPRRIEINQVPDAHMLRHVQDCNGREGTIIVPALRGDALPAARRSDGRCGQERSIDVAVLHDSDAGRFLDS
jgi:hypothetical protein